MFTKEILVRCAVTVSDMIAAANNKALIRKILDKALVTVEVFAHTVGYLYYSPRHILRGAYSVINIIPFV